MLTATDDDAIATFYAVASSQMDEDGLATWVHANSMAP